MPDVIPGVGMSQQNSKTVSNIETTVLNEGTGVLNKGTTVLNEETTKAEAVLGTDHTDPKSIDDDKATVGYLVPVGATKAENDDDLPEIFVYHSDERKRFVSYETLPAPSVVKRRTCRPDACCHYL
jgi:hypothetical protein